MILSLTVNANEKFWEFSKQRRVARGRGTLVPARDSKKGDICHRVPPFSAPTDEAAGTESDGLDRKGPARREVNSRGTEYKICLPQRR